MIGFRWLVLRIFFSLLALPFVAFLLLWLLHEVIFPGGDFQDLPIILITYGLLFAAVSSLLRRNGLARYNYLQEQTQLALSANDDDDLEAIFFLTRKLFASGLLSQKLTAQLQREMRRQFLSIYGRNLDTPEAVEELRLALHEGYRRGEIYALLKNHLLSQPILTIGLIDLAEELLEQHPEDEQLLEFLVRKLVNGKARHYRAEYFYGRYLTHSGEHTPAIISLCLENLLAKQRRDDFALWVYVRAVEAGHSENVNVRRLLFVAHQRNQEIERQDRLAMTVSKIAGSFSAEEFAATKSVQVERPTPFYVIWQRRLADGLFVAKKMFLEYYSSARPLIKEFYARHRRYVLVGAGALALIVGFGIIFANRPTTKAPAQEVVDTDDNAAGYFALQVGAWKKARSAEQEKERLQHAGLRVRILTPRSSAGWYRIHVGKYPTRRAAQAAADSLKRVGVIEDYFIAGYERR